MPLLSPTRLHPTHEVRAGGYPGGWREMAAIFPASFSREPIAFLDRALRRQLRLRNCLCHVRHIFLAFPLFLPRRWLLTLLSFRFLSPFLPLDTHPTRFSFFVLSSVAPISRPRLLFLCHTRFRVSYFFSLFIPTTPGVPQPSAHFPRT